MSTAIKFDVTKLVLVLLLVGALVGCIALFVVMFETLSPGPAKMPAYIASDAAQTAH
jgi:hypothetical protein